MRQTSPNRAICSDCKHQWHCPTGLKVDDVCPRCDCVDIDQIVTPGQTLSIARPRPSLKDRFEVPKGLQFCEFPNHLRITLEVSNGDHKGRTYEITKSRTSIGRQKEDINLHDMQSSRNHMALLVYNEDACVVRDLASTNGTFVNGERVLQALLKSGDILRVGNTEMLFRAVERN